MSFTINSMVFKVFLPILVGLAIFGTLDSIKVNSLDPNINSLDDALGSFDREIVLANKEDDRPLNSNEKEKARGKLREAVIINVMMSQNCGLTLKPEEAEVVTEQDKFQKNTLEVLQDLAGGSESDGSASIFYPHSSEGPYTVLREDDFGISCTGADQLSSNIPGASALTENEGNDMEGKYGRIGFEVANNFTIKDTRIAAFRFPNLGGEDTEGVYTDLLMGAEVLTFAPDGCEGNNFYDSKVRMQNIPVIIDGSSKPNPCSEPNLAFNTGNVNYMMCEGANGYIQTNVGGETGEHTLDKEDQLASAYFNYLDGLGGAIEFAAPFPIPNIFEETAGGVKNFVEDEFVKVDVNPKMLIRQKADDCLDDLTVRESRVVSSAIDLEGDGDREKCEFDDFESFGENSEDWKGLDAKCGLESTGDDRYKTVWYKEGDSCYEDMNIVGSYRVENGADKGRSYSENGLNMEGYADGTVTTNTVGYNLNSFEDISELEINFANTGSDFEVKINGEELRAVSALQSGDPAEYIEIGGENMDADGEWEQKEGATNSGYKLVIEPSQNNLEWSWNGGSYEYPQNSGQPDIPDQIDSISFEQTGESDSMAEIRSFKISGGASC